MIRPTNVHSLSEFLRNSKAFSDRIEEQREPVGLTVNGKVKLVVMDASTFEELSTLQERQRLIDAVREGERAIQSGDFRPAELVFEEIKSKYGF